MWEENVRLSGYLCSTLEFLLSSRSMAHIVFKYPNLRINGVCSIADFDGLQWTKKSIALQL